MLEYYTNCLRDAEEMCAVYDSISLDETKEFFHDTLCHYKELVCMYKDCVLNHKK